jgi:hypothetical protein
MNQTQLINDWERATNDLCNHFCLKYFDKDADIHWISDDIGGTLYINDYFFSVDQIVDFLKCKYSSKKLFEWYNYQMECAYKEEHPINIKNYGKINN